MHTISNFIYELVEEEEEVDLFFPSRVVVSEYAGGASFSLEAEEAEAYYGPPEFPCREGRGGWQVLFAWEARRLMVAR